MSHGPHNPTHPRPKLPVREAATDVVRRLRDAGYEAYFAGGCVRDRLMGAIPEDYDIATMARPEEIREIFRGSRSVGEAFGVVLVRRGGHTFDVATFRAAGHYADGRRPEEVTFADARADADRRDFTINGLFEDPLEDQIIDFVGGQADIEARIVRAIGDPLDRIHEDRLRMLRAVRFAARFEFEIEAGTAEAIRRNAHDLAGVSRERIGEEVRRMFLDPNRGVAAWEIQYLDLDAAVLGEESKKVSPMRLGRLPANAQYATCLAAWLLDRHGSTTPDVDSVALRWSEHLMLSNADRTDMWTCLQAHLVLLGDWSRLGVARQKRLAANEAFERALMILQTCDRPAFVDIRRQVIELAKTELAPTPLIGGDDLIEMGFRPGPVFRRVLDAVYDAQLEGAISSLLEAKALAKVLAEEG